jgi:hypothetical protein
MVSLRKHDIKFRIPQKLCNLLSRSGAIFVQQILDSSNLFSTAKEEGAKIIMSDRTKCWESTRGLSEGAVAEFVWTDRRKPLENSFKTDSSPAEIRKYLSNTVSLPLHESALNHAKSTALAVFIERK